jgi:hypothetical protein
MFLPMSLIAKALRFLMQNKAGRMDFRIVVKQLQFSPYKSADIDLLWRACLHRENAGIQLVCLRASS